MASEYRDLGGGISVQLVEVHGDTLPSTRYFAVRLAWYTKAVQQNSQAAYWVEKMGGMVEVRVYPPSVMPPTLGWRVEGAVPDIHVPFHLNMKDTLGHDFPTLEEAITAVEAGLRTYDANRRLRGAFDGG